MHAPARGATRNELQWKIAQMFQSTRRAGRDRNHPTLGRRTDVSIHAGPGGRRHGSFTGTWDDTETFQSTPTQRPAPPEQALGPDQLLHVVSIHAGPAPGDTGSFNPHRRRPGDRAQALRHVVVVVEVSIQTGHGGR